VANPSVVVDFVANTSKLVQGVKDVGTATNEAGNAVRKVDWKRIALFGAGAAAVGAGVKYLKDATSNTISLAKATLQLSRTTGMDTKTASEWAAVLRTRGIDVGVFSRGMVTLSKQMQAATQGSAKSVDAFKALGVSMDDVRKGNTQKVLMEVADGLSKMSNPAQKAALTQQLLSRSGLQLAPILYKGSAAIQDQLNMANKYGDSLSGKTTKSVVDLIDKQREMQYASDGVKVQLGTALLPVIIAVAGVIVELVRVLQPLISNATVLKTLLVTFAAVWAAYTIATGAATVATTLFGTTLATSVILATGGAVLAIAALIAIGVLLYKNWDTVSAAMGKAFDAIQAAAEAVWKWIKANWPLLVGIITGPLGLAVALVVTHWGTIKQVTTQAWQAIKDTVSGVLASIRGAVTSFANWFTQAWADVRSQLSKVAGWFDVPLDAAKAMLAGIKKAVQSVPDAIAAVIDACRREASAVANAIKAPINAVIGAWNGLAFTLPKIDIPKVHIPHVGDIGGGSFGGQSWAFPNIPKLAQGGVFDTATLALVGEGQGREIVTPESLLRQIVAQMTPAVHVYIGDTELKDLVRVEVVTQDNATAQAVLGGVV